MSHPLKNHSSDRMRDIDKSTNGWSRRKGVLRKKTEVVMEMIARAWQNNIDSSFVLFNSWFSHDDVIAKIKDIAYGVICCLIKRKGKIYISRKKIYPETTLQCSKEEDRMDW